MSTPSVVEKELEQMMSEPLALFRKIESHLNRFPEFAKEFDDRFANRDAEKIFDLLIIRGSDLDDVSKITGYSPEYLVDFEIYARIVCKAKGKNLSLDEASRWVVRFMNLGSVFFELEKEGKYPNLK